MPGKKHVIVTCYDGRLDAIVKTLVEEIRTDGGIVDDKDIFRPPGGVHFVSADPRDRSIFYKLLSGYHDIARTTVFHLLPHTNCQYCGRYHQEKLGNGIQSDLHFHLRSAEKLLDGALQHFGRLSPDIVPELDVRIILTVDQRIVTIDEAHDLLPHVPDHAHGAPCCGHLRSTREAA